MKMDASEIEVNGVKYVPKGTESAIEYSGPIKIVVLQRGWVLIGRLEESDSVDDEMEIHNAQVIRNWGTTKGLGELAKDGPQSSTKLDPCHGIVTFHKLTKVLDIAVNEAKWKNLL